MLTQQLISGFLASGIYALYAVGFSMIFGIMGVLNMAHADFGMVAALSLIYVIAAGINPVLGVPIALVVTLVIAVLAERLAMRPGRRYKGDASIEMPLIATIGLSMLLQNGAALVFGHKALIFPYSLQKFIRIGTFFISEGLLCSMAVAIVLLVALELFVNGTSFGRQMRAVALNPSAAKIMGINTNRTVVITVGITALLAAVAGCLTGMTYGLVSPYMGMTYAIKGLVAMIVGGVGTLRGAMLGAVLIGLSEAVAVTYFGSQARDLTVLVVLMFILTLRPNGLVSAHPGR